VVVVVAVLKVLVLPVPVVLAVAVQGQIRTLRQLLALLTRVLEAAVVVKIISVFADQAVMAVPAL
jgi:hypothetical protein